MDGGRLVLFAREVMDLLAAYPGRPWKMGHIINHVARGRPTNHRERERYRKGISRVLAALVEHGVVIRKPARPGGTPLYVWRKTRTRSCPQGGQDP